MLTYIKAVNIALIEETELSLHSGLNIFTGETGAGKSMLIDSIQFAIGNRTSKQIIRKGQDMASVTLKFTDEEGDAIAYIRNEGLEINDNIIIMERVIFKSGRTTYKVNGSVVTRQFIKDLSTKLIDVHGQHEPQSLLDISSHIHLLDSFGEAKFEKIKSEYEEKYTKWQEVNKAINKIGDNDRKKLQLKDMLTFQIKEINDAGLKSDSEEDDLKEQYEMLSHAEKIMIQSNKAYEFIDGDGEASVSLLLGQAIYALQDISDITSESRAIYDQFLSIQAELQDATYQMRRFSDGVEYSPELLMEVQNRLDLIYRLKQKYGTSIKEIKEYCLKCEEELEELELGEQNKDELLEKQEKLSIELGVLGEKLTNERRAIATRIEKAIDNHLHDLQMPHAKFEVEINELDTFNSLGQNDVEFLIRTNLGEDVHSLSKIASGGEISRVMLAIKTVLVLGDTIDTVIFDEIDTGISGIAAQKVAEKLAVISKSRQVLCITHLPQIAAMGDTHFLIEKEFLNSATRTRLKELEGELLHEEICRLMGGIITESTLKSAVEIKTRANEYRNNI